MNEEAKGDERIADDLVNHALRDALSRSKHRDSVLRLEQEVEVFVCQSTDEGYIFQGEMSSYDRLLTHRTAQHWGLETSTISQGPDQGRIMATRTPKTGRPKLKLADVQIPVLDEDASFRDAAAPRLLVRRKNSDRTPRSHAQHARQQMNKMQQQPIEDREVHYEKARARIFGDAHGPSLVNGTNGTRPGYNSTQPIPQRPEVSVLPYPSYGMMPYGVVPMHPPPPPPPVSSNVPRGKAQLRNRQEDLSDPDFRRGRYAPRFDPGFGEGSQGGMYSRPTYGSEFPELGHVPMMPQGMDAGRTMVHIMPTGMGGPYPVAYHQVGYAPYPTALPPPPYMGYPMPPPSMMEAHNPYHPPAGQNGNLADPGYQQNRRSMSSTSREPRRSGSSRASQGSGDGRREGFHPSVPPPYSPQLGNR
jgi:hypothetical protein